MLRELRICPTHGECEHTYYSKSGRNGQWKCMKCESELAVLKKKRFKLKCVEYKGGKCELCGYDKNISALEFHHVDSTQKDFGISTTHRVWELVKSELDKCMLLCANCHREIHNQDSTKENLEKILSKRNERIHETRNQKYRDKIPFTYDELYKSYSILKTWDKVAKHYNISISTLKRYRNKIKPW